MCLPISNPLYVEMLQEFEQVIIARAHSGGRGGHPRRAREFLFFLEQKKIEDINDLRTADVIAFYEYLKERPNLGREGNLSDSYVRAQMGTIRTFFDHLLETKRIENLPCSLPRFSYAPGKEKTPLTEEQIKLLYAACKDRTDRAVLSCAYGCGLRAAEAAALDVSDLVFGKGVIVVREGKNNKSRSVPMAQGVVKELKEYLLHERPNRLFYERPCPSLFLSVHGQRPEKQWYNKRFKAIVKRTGNKELMAMNPSIHVLRHSITVHMIDRGATAEFTRAFLGHALLDTTIGIYAKRRALKARLMEVIGHHRTPSDIKAK